MKLQIGDKIRYQFDGPGKNQIGGKYIEGVVYFKCPPSDNVQTKYIWFDQTGAFHYINFSMADEVLRTEIIGKNVFSK